MSNTNFDVWKSAIDTWQLGSHILQDLRDTVDQDVFLQCVDLIAECQHRILVSGVGTSGAAAKKISHSLSCIEKSSFYLSPGDAAHGELGVVKEGDIVILISKGGASIEINNLLPALKAKKAKIIAVTANTESYLAQQADTVLVVRIGREADPFNMLATTSTLAVLAVFDAICIAVMQVTNFTKQQFALIHPGGAVGNRLQSSS